MKQTFAAGRALLIGIGQGYPGRLELPGVVRADAEGVARVLTDPALCGYPDENVQLLLDEQATRANIIEGLHRLANTAQPDDTVFLFFSGHGGQRTIGADAGTYLCPVDFDSNDPRSTGIEANELSTLISAIPAVRVIVVLDACHSEGAVFLKDVEEEKRLSFGFRSPALDKLAAGAGRVVVSSCKDEETSITYIEKGHSLFTYFLLEGLRGGAMDRGDGLVRVLDLFHYVSDEVPRNARGGHKQHPVLKAHAETNFPLALRKGGRFKSTTGAAPFPVKQHTDVKQFEKVLSQLYPSGPGHNEVWSRAGGDQSTLMLSGNGRASWHAAIRLLSQGGGGQEISLGSLIETALSDYPNNTELRSLTE
jgi:hypothetical protein